MTLDNHDELGVLTTHLSLTIHTKECVKLLKGRVIDSQTETDKTYTINGLELYSRRLNKIWHKIKNDDPYAEMVLIEIERRIERAKNKMAAALKKADTLLAKAPPGLAIGITQSVKPITMPLNNVLYYTVHTKLAAVLLADFDLWIRKLKSCIAIGQLTKTQYKKQVLKLETVIRGVLIAPSLYMDMNICREDVKQATDKGKAAIERFGLVPIAILNNEQHSAFGPISAKQ